MVTAAATSCFVICYLVVRLMGMARVNVDSKAISMMQRRPKIPEQNQVDQKWASCCL